MPTTFPSARQPALEPELIQRLAVILTSSLDGSSSAPPEVMAAGLRCDNANGVDVALRRLYGDDPVADLVGFVAPDDWIAFGIVASGRWYAMGEHEVGPDGLTCPPFREADGRVRLASFVTREGEAVSATSQDGDEPTVQWLDPGRPNGRADDVCRRALGLPTPAPRRDVRELWGLVWCDVIAERVLDRGCATWTDIATAHPAIGHLGISEATSTAWAVDNLVRLGEQFGALHPWEDLRQLCARNEWQMQGIDSEDAAWMDEGMFSRWNLASYPELGEILEDLTSLLPEDVSYRVWRTMDAWGLP